MKIVTLFVLIFAMQSCPCLAQLLSGDAQGKSAILFDANAINFDIGETALSFNINNFRKQSIVKRYQAVWGISAKGQNNEGIANLLSEGKFLPSGQLGMFVGLAIRGPKSTFEIESKIRELRKSTNLSNYEALMNFKKTTDTIWKAERSKIIAFRRKKLEADLRKAVDQERFKDVVNQLDKLKEDVGNWTDTLNSTPLSDQIYHARALIDLLKTKLGDNYKRTKKPLSNNDPKTLEQAYQDESDRLFSLVREESKMLKESNPSKIVPYLSFGLTGSQVKLYDKTIIEPFSKRFVKTPFTGVYTDLGINIDIGKKSLLGISAGFERANTIDSLTAVDYTIRETEKVGNTELISEKKEKGYTGTYETYTRFNFRLDWLHPVELGEKGQLIWNIPYVRYAISDKKRAAVNLLNAGTSANFFKEEGKFAGGIYLELGDILNKQYDYQLALAPNDAARLEVIKNKGNIWKRVTFGVVAKFAIQSIMSPTNW